jgi:hypothetical protein
MVMDPNLRCRGRIKAHEVEPRVWTVVERVLQQPELIAAEVAHQRADADERRAALAQEMDHLTESVARCDREAQRWAEADAAEVMNLAELKGDRAEITARRQGLHDQHITRQEALEATGQAVDQVEALMRYCDQVRQRLQTFDEGEKRLALEALDIRVTWTPNQPLAIQGSIPIDDIVPVPSGCEQCRFLVCLCAALFLPGGKVLRKLVKLGG